MTRERLSPVSSAVQMRCVRWLGSAGLALAAAQPAGAALLKKEYRVRKDFSNAPMRHHTPHARSPERGAPISHSHSECLWLA